MSSLKRGLLQVQTTQVIPLAEIDASLLEKIADLTGKPVGAFNIRKDMGCEARQSTEHIAIDPRADGKPGIDIRFQAGTKGETCHIPVIISQTGMSDMVYNDFYVADDCDVNIVAGCGIHNCGDCDSEHDGIHTFYCGKNSHVKYVEKHYGEGAGTGERPAEAVGVALPAPGVVLEQPAGRLAGAGEAVLEEGEGRGGHGWLR